MSQECVRCGHCCPDTCKFKVHRDDGLVDCKIHPTTTGSKYNVMPMCNGRPIFYWNCGLACKAIMIERGIDPSTVKTAILPNGQVIRLNQNEELILATQD
jgi:hypothetical protein